MIVQDITRPMIPRKLIQLMQGRILGQKCTLHTLTKRLKIEFDQPTTIQIDGELYDDLPFDVRVVQGGLRMYRPE